MYIYTFLIAPSLLGAIVTTQGKHREINMASVGLFYSPLSWCWVYACSSYAETNVGNLMLSCFNSPWIVQLGLSRTGEPIIRGCYSGANLQPSARASEPKRKEDDSMRGRMCVARATGWVDKRTHELDALLTPLLPIFFDSLFFLFFFYFTKYERQENITQVL